MEGFESYKHTHENPHDENETVGFGWGGEEVSPRMDVAERLRDELIKSCEGSDTCELTPEQREARNEMIKTLREQQELLPEYAGEIGAMILLLNNVENEARNRRTLQ